ncbi:MAG: hypothetical protein JWL71_2904 [Acidobacteria bacterium]|nr:hypothetical protein [Acidobacteriota bacterium]
MHVVGGVAIALDGEAPAGTGEHSAEPPELTLRLAATRARSPFRPLGSPTIEQDSWVAFAEDGVLKLCIKQPSLDEAMRIELPLDGLEGQYFWDFDWPFPFRFPIDQLLVIHALGVGGGALMHAAAIAGRDGAFLVAGPSGAGKTTLSRAAALEGAAVLSDERTILRPSRAHAGGWLLGGTPWPGEGQFSDNRSIPLRGLILLEQSDRDELMPISAARALALLYRCHFPPLWDPAACARTLDNLERAVRDVPAFLFKNRKGPEAARMLLERLGGAS